MSKLQIFTVRDSKAEAFMSPFFMQANGQAIRAFADSVNGQNEQFSKHPEDYSLWHLGSYDEATGVITCLDVPVCLGKGVDFNTKA